MRRGSVLTSSILLTLAAALLLGLGAPPRAPAQDAPKTDGPPRAGPPPASRGSRR